MEMNMLALQPDTGKNGKKAIIYNLLVFFKKNP